MEQTVSYAASIELLSRYVRDRLPARIFVPLSLFLAAGAGIGAGASDFPDYTLRSLAAFCLVLQFRLWDDLESLAHDRSAHPGRLLCRLPDPALVSRLLPILAAANLAVIYGLSSDWTRPALLIVLMAVFAIGYRCARRVPLAPLGASHLLLLKYPMFVWILSPTHLPQPTLPLLLGMASVFLSFGIHEILHDDRFRSNPVALRVAIAESLSLIALLTVLALLHHHQTDGWTTPLLVQSSCPAIAALLLVRLARPPRPKPHLGMAYAFFLAGYLAFLTFPSGMNP